MDGTTNTLIAGFFGIITALISVFGTITVAVIKTQNGKWNIPSALWIGIVGLIGTSACCIGTVVGASLFSAPTSTSTESAIFTPNNPSNQKQDVATQVAFTPVPSDNTVSGCFCQPSNCNGIQVDQGSHVPASAIVEPHAGNRGTLYIYLSPGQAAIPGNLWVYVDSNGSPASQSCIDSQLQYFQYNEIQTIK